MKTLPLLLLLLTAALPFKSARARTIRFQLLTGVPGQRAYLAANLNDWQGDSPAMRFEETGPGAYELALEEPWLPALHYKFVVDGDWMADPSNPLREPDGYGGFNSVLEAVEFREDPLLSPRPGVPAWVRTSLRLRDLENRTRSVYVLSPPAKPRKKKPSARTVTVYFQDGGDYLDRTGVANLLANLSREPGMPVLTGVFVPPMAREDEYGILEPASDRYIEWFTGSLVPEIERRFQTGGSPERRVLIGPSLGGLITVYTAMLHPEIFGRAGSQSGSLWWKDYAILRHFDPAARSGLRLFLEVGTYETPSMTDSNRRAFAEARAVGLDVGYREFPSTHDWIAWRNRLGLILRFLVSQ